MSIRLFTQALPIILPEEIRSKALDFSTRVIATVDYSDSNQLSRDKIQRDHFVSKVGEEAARAAFIMKTHDVSEPDYSVYMGSKKSWAPDLKVHGIALAIKCQSRSAAKRYGLSWTFQDSEIRKDPILHQPDAWVCFVEYNDENEAQTECIVFPPFQIKELRFRAPLLSHLRTKKKVVYAKDIDTLLQKLNQ